MSTLLSKRRARGSNGTLAICVFAAVTVASATWTAEARANPFGYREHDGFYLRLSGGAGALAVDRSTESEGPQNSLVYGDSSSVGSWFEGYTDDSPGRGRVQGMAGLGPVHGEGGHSARGLEDQVAVGHGGYDRSR